MSKYIYTKSTSGKSPHIDPHLRRHLQERRERDEALGFPYADYEAAGWRAIGKAVLFIIAIIVFVKWVKP